MNKIVPVVVKTDFKQKTTVIQRGKSVIKLGNVAPVSVEIETNVQKNTTVIKIGECSLPIKPALPVLVEANTENTDIIEGLCLSGMNIMDTDAIVEFHDLTFG